MDKKKEVGLMKNLYLDVLNENLNEIDFCNVFNNDFKRTNIEMNIKNEEDRYLIEGIFPGMQRKDIKVDFKDECIYVRAQKKQFFSNDDSTAMIIIRDSRDFVKNFQVPNSDASKIKASFKGCKLTLEIPTGNIIY
ncbi:MAG: Hsp20 family protein, partial [Clostridium sp.]|uniref:Hsp20 family protein n=1 Tax=Clostridium sp. TaxID=1506 RepID=UPI003F34EBC5